MCSSPGSLQISLLLLHSLSQDTIRWKISKNAFKACFHVYGVWPVWSQFRLVYSSPQFYSTEKRKEKKGLTVRTSE